MRDNENPLLLQYPQNVGHYQLSYISNTEATHATLIIRENTYATIRRVTRQKGCESRGDRRRLLLRAMRIFRNILWAGVVCTTDTANLDTTTTGGEGFYRMIPTSWPIRIYSSGRRFLSNGPAASSFANLQKVSRTNQRSTPRRRTFHFTDLYETRKLARNCSSPAWDELRKVAENKGHVFLRKHRRRIICYEIENKVT